jgi:hypothetical protein
MGSEPFCFEVELATPNLARWNPSRSARCFAAPSKTPASDCGRRRYAAGPGTVQILCPPSASQADIPQARSLTPSPRGRNKQHNAFASRLEAIARSFYRILSHRVIRVAVLRDVREFGDAHRRSINQAARRVAF